MATRAHPMPHRIIKRCRGNSDIKCVVVRDGGMAGAKMCRSLMIKGLEALFGESLLSARQYGVEQTVIESLEDLLPGPDWTKISRYMISRSIVHGRRRAEEMREVARTVADAGINPWMSAATVERQEWAARTGAGLDLHAWPELLDGLRERVAAEPRQDASTGSPGGA